MALTTRHFRDQHEQLLRLADQVLAVVEGRSLETRAKEARATIDTYGAHLRQHLAAEDASLYAELAKSSDANVRSTAADFVAEMGGLAEAFKQYEDQWTENAIRARPADFTTATRTVFDAVRRRIEREDSILYPLANGMSVSAPGTSLPFIKGSPPVVFIVDDNESDFVLLKEAWSETRVECAFEYFPVAESFLSRISRPARADLIIIDINLPILGGRELVRRMRMMPEFKRVPIVMCSSAVDPRDSGDASACGANGFYPKPATFEEYLPFVRTMNDLIAYYR